MSIEEPTEQCYSEIVSKLEEGERETVAEAAALLASTADRMAQVKSDEDAEGMAVELRRIANEQARIEEIAVSPCSGAN
ncbi:hypothetical protein B4589_011740 [Halolamina sp. CBA1230]|uniref:hypothetical protein n=1 Tax=Halolamina sp. CBA1230 TaxID=1853690 RepID=UPI0009A18D0F|nr:hypothetical protein [Halolamina sp. CBA1230]QKY21013.1 hypothetical protein B4589_011740 [Halolamina sp. CBA1230]